MTLIDAILVHFHSGAHTCEAIASLRADWARSGIEGRIVVVDNGSSAEECAALEGMGAERIDAGGNRGFAGGVNLGVARGAAPAILLVNPDVRLEPGCTEALLAALDGGADAAAPQCVWGGERGVLLPPTEPLDFRYRLLRRSGARSGPALSRARRLWRRHARRHWEATSLLPSSALSGAVLAIRRQAWQQVGHFDEAFFMYYEETDWLQRLWREGGSSVHVPAARAQHFVGGSSPDAAAAAGYSLASERRFFDRRYGRVGHALLRGLAACLPSVRTAPPLPWHPPAQPLPRPAAGDLWLELSPLASGLPATGIRWTTTQGDAWTMPAGLWAQLTPGSYSLIISDQQEHELHAYRFTK